MQFQRKMMPLRVKPRIVRDLSLRASRLSMLKAMLVERKSLKP
jgi:hypothetical protein